VLRPAEWRLGAATAGVTSTTRDSFKAFLEQQRTTWQLPAQIYLSSGDVRLLLDLDDPEHVEELRRDVRRLKPGMHVLVQEALPGLEDAWLPGPGGHYIVELVVSLALKDAFKHEAQRSAALMRSEQNLARMIPPGGEWIFLKLYGSPETEEDLVTGPVTDFLREAAASGLCGEFFFIRYSDPDPHLRLRLRTPAPADADTMLSELCTFGRSLMEGEWCNRFAVDTYEREIERYGGPEVISAAEALFVADSALVVELFRLLKRTDLAREMLAAVTAADLLDGFGLSDPLLAGLKSRLRSIRQEAGAAYRKLKTSPLVEDPDLLAREPGGADVLRCLERRRAAASAVGSLLHRLEAEGRLTAPPVEICHSFLHMHCNRLLGRDRAEERKVLGLMFRVREARQARHATAQNQIVRQSRKGNLHPVV
jgi:thiopeptide-type bacteriocin biosynthesis protein